MSENDKKLILVDAMALIYRAHFAFINNPRLNSKGFNTSAVLGFTNSLVEILEKEQPTHIAIAFDCYAPTVRHQEFSEYKANREKQPEDITVSIPIIKSMVQAFRIPILEVEGYEADDIIGTLARQASSLDYKVYMFTPDKDFSQLVNENTFLYKPARMGNPSEIWDVDKVREKFGIERIDQVVEIQGLMGDAVDNIPGVPGIGPKTAQKLIAEFDNIENLLQNTDKLKGKQKELLEEYGEQAILSKKLATIITDVPVEFNEEEFAKQEVDINAIEPLLAELEFKNLGKKLLGKEPVKKQESPSIIPGQTGLFEEDEARQIKSFQNLNKKYIQVQSESEIEQLVRKLESSEKFSFFIVVNISNPYDASITGISFSITTDEGFYIKVSRDESDAVKVLENFKRIFENPVIEKMGHDLKFASIVLKNYGINLAESLFDTKIAHYLIDSESKHDLDFLAEKYLSYSLMVASGDSFKDYYAEKADVIYQLSKTFESDIKEGDLEKLYYEIESPLIGVLADVEREGVKVDENVLKDYSKELVADQERLEKEIHGRTGVPFNLNSPQQMGHVLFNILKLDPKAKKTRKSGQYSTSEEVLAKLAPKHKIVEYILEYRSLQKLRSTYVDALPELINVSTGRIHTSFNQAVTSTGRLSSTNPNLQNIPIRTERGRYVRKAFVPRDEGHVLLSADYSQVELRLIADISNDKNMIEAFNEGQDIHSSTASKIYNIDLTDIGSEHRRKAKVVNFGIIYGISGWGLAQRLGISRSEGKEIIDQYFKTFPRIRTYMDETIAFAKDNGYVKTLLGRKRFLRDINSGNATIRSFAERNAINAPIQGTAADLIKIAMVNIHQELQTKDMKSKMILQVHDELVFDVKKEELESIKEIVRDKMENALALKVPLTIDMGVGKNWLEAH